jgi:hypothetical protein
MSAGSLDPRIIELTTPEGLRGYQVVMPDDHAPDLAELQAMATATGGSGRLVSFVLLDESRLRDHGRPEDSHVVDLARFVDGAAVNVPLVLGDESLRIGMLTGLHLVPAGEWPETTGRCLLGVAQLADSPLARGVWEGMRAGLLDGVCAVYRGQLEAGRAIYQQLVRVIVMPKRDAGCSAARILQTIDVDQLPE